MAEPSGKDKVLEDYLGGGSRLSQAYREASDELPPAELDSRILSEARRAVESKTPHPAGPFSGRWMLPASLAVVVLAVSVVVLLPYSQSPLEQRPNLRTTPSPATLPTVEPAGVAPATGGRIISSGELKQPKEQRPEAPKKSRPALAEDAPPAKFLYAPDALELKPAPSSSPEQPAPRRSQPAEREDRAVSGEGMILKEEVGRQDRQRESSADEAEATRRLESRQYPVPSLELMAPDADAARSEPRSLPDTARTDPAAWLDFIRRLIDAGRLEEAARQLEAFKRQFPDHKIPAKILSALGKRQE